MNKLRTLFHPIFVFVGVQIAWIVLMAVWIYWYIKNSRKLEDFAERIRPGLLESDLNWVILVEGCFLMLMILAGVYVIFVYWNKQERLNQMQSNFVSSVSHELKSPLASIQLYLETLKYQNVSEDEKQDFVETMLSDTERLSGLIDNILESSRSGTKTIQLQLEQVNLEPFLTEIVDEHKRQLEDKGCAVTLETQGSPVLTIDKKAMRMVFNNLISNALRYSPAGSPLVIRVRINKGQCAIDFIDKGFGFAKRDLKRVFKKFYRVQTKATQNIEGAGLGLFIAAEIVKSHKGKIRAESEGRGQGSTITVTLPLQKDAGTTNDA